MKINLKFNINFKAWTIQFVLLFQWEQYHIQISLVRLLHLEYFMANFEKQADLNFFHTLKIR